MTANVINLPRPHPAQVEVLEGKRRFNVVACGRRWGKTKLGGSLALQGALNGFPVGWFAPSYKVLGDALREIQGRVAGVNGIAYKSQERLMSFPTGGSIEFWSTEPQQAGDDESEVARGRKYARVVYDEAAHARRLAADWNKAIRATLVDLRGDAWFMSTPRGQNEFYRMYLRGQSGDAEWASWSMPTARNPHIAPEEIESARRDMPADAFEQEFEAKFLANAANPFGIDAIRAAVDTTIEADGHAVACWGIDLAKSHDWTVAIGLDARGRMVAFQRWQGDWRQTRHRVMAMVKRTPARIDSTGVGDPIVEDVVSACPLAEGYQFTSQSKQRLMEGLAYAIQNREVTYPANPILLGELESFQYEYKPSGVRYTAPEGLHDDCVCALALAVECLRTAPQPARLSVLTVERGGASRADAFGVFDRWGDDD